MEFGEALFYWYFGVMGKKYSIHIRQKNDLREYYTCLKEVNWFMVIHYAPPEAYPERSRSVHVQWTEIIKLKFDESQLYGAYSPLSPD